MMQVGIIGLPNVGKSTLFNALTKGNALVESYPFSTIQPNLGRIALKDANLSLMKTIFKPAKITPAFINFLDIAGLVAGAHRGEGLGNQFLDHIRKVEVLVHVLRGFHDEHVAHLEGQIDPLRDLKIVELELMLADLASLEKRMQKTRSMCQTNEKRYFHELEFYEKLKDHLDQGKLASSLKVNPEEKKYLNDLFLLTAKPMLYVLNGTSTRENLEYQKKIENIEGLAKKTLILDFLFESELHDLTEEEKSMFLMELGLKSALDSLALGAYDLLGLLRFYTGNENELRAWTLTEGSVIVEAAEKIHSDIAQGFIKGEVIGAPLLIEIGTWQKAREKGFLRIEGRDYKVSNEDVIYFHFR